MTEDMNVHSNFGVTHIMMSVGQIGALKVISKSKLEVCYADTG
jgi:hypothetical protein